jgi:hypothetical protein
MRQGANRLALPYSFTSASPANISALKPRSFNARESKKTSCTEWRRRSADGATFCATRVVIWAWPNRIGSLDQDRRAERCSSGLYGETSAFVCSPIENLTRQRHEIRFCEQRPAHDLLVIRNRSAWSQKCLNATFSSRFNPALPTFSRTPFVAKDVAIEDSTCARGR